METYNRRKLFDDDDDDENQKEDEGNFWSTRLLAPYNPVEQKEQEAKAETKKEDDEEYTY